MKIKQKKKIIKKYLTSSKSFVSLYYIYKQIETTTMKNWHHISNSNSNRINSSDYMRCVLSKLKVS